MNELFERAKKITSIGILQQNESVLDEKTMITDHINEIVELFSDSCEENILCAAQRGSTHAILGLWGTNAHHRVINVDVLFEPTTTLIDKMTEYNITPLLNVFIDKFKPFSVSICSIWDLEEFQHLDETISGSYRILVVDWT